MRNIINVDNVGQVSNECKIVIYRMSEMLDKFKQIDINIERLKEGDKAFSKYIDETQVEYLIYKLMRSLDSFQEIECSARDMWQELIVACCEKGDN